MDRRELSLRKLELQHKRESALLDSGVRLLSNPMVALVGGIAAVEYMRKKELFSFLTAGIIETAILSATMTNAVAKSGIINQLATTGQDSVAKGGTIVKDVLPLLLAAGAVA